MILKYQKITDGFTTYALVEPAYNEGDNQITELCTIRDDTYCHVPDNLVLPAQPFCVEASMESIALADELKTEIKAISPHVRLINKRVVEKIREKYTPDDELKMHREFVENGSTSETQAYIDYVADCRKSGQAEKAKIGL